MGKTKLSFKTVIALHRKTIGLGVYNFRKRHITGVIMGIWLSLSMMNAIKIISQYRWGQDFLTGIASLNHQILRKLK